MVRLLAREDLTALARGYALLGSGGGGTTTMLELMLARAESWPIPVSGVDDLDAAAPCLGAAFVGSTMLLGERMPGCDPFGPLIAAVERWLGTRVPAVCSLEGGGMNGLVPLLLAPDRTIVDADGTGRAVPSLDQMSLFVDRVPGLVFACESGAGGVTLVETDRAIDAERIVRAAIIQAGGAGAAVLAGFTVGDLREHAIGGHLERALSLGASYLAAATSEPAALAAALGGRMLTTGRITAASPFVVDPHVSTIEIAGDDGGVHRLIARSETLAMLSDGALVAATPTIIAVIDALSREVLEVADLTPGRYVIVLSLPAPEWWSGRSERLQRVRPSAYGLADLDAA